jgi:hypothetical protein
MANRADEGINDSVPVLEIVSAAKDRARRELVEVGIDRAFEDSKRRSVETTISNCAACDVKY